MGTKKNKLTSMLVDGDDWTYLKEYGINVSQFIRKSMREYRRQLEAEE